MCIVSAVIFFFSTLNANDCFELASQLQGRDEYLSATAWFEETLDRFEDNSLNNIPKAFILGELALLYSKIRKYILY